LRADAPTLCDKGLITHPHLHENDNFSGPVGTTLDAPAGSNTGAVEIADFLYAPGDLSMISMTGIPTAKTGQKIAFTNWDTAIDVFHTITSCAFPCTGPTGTSFPLANGATSAGRAVDFDSGQLGYGTPEITGAKQTANWQLDLTGYQPGEIVTYYCRIHPFMRGAVEVTE
jgi:plastocyanin